MRMPIDGKGRAVLSQAVKPHGALLSCALIGISALLSVPSTSAEAVERDSLYNVSQTILRSYKTKDAPGLHSILAPELQARYTVKDVKDVLDQCYTKFGEITRFSLPTMGARTYAFFGVYASTGTYDMILEINPNEKIYYWVVTPDVNAPDQICTLNNIRSSSSKTHSQ
jgi:hypothetical protein